MYGDKRVEKRERERSRASLIVGTHAKKIEIEKRKGKRRSMKHWMHSQKLIKM